MKELDLSEAFDDASDAVKHLGEAFNKIMENAIATQCAKCGCEMMVMDYEEESLCWDCDPEEEDEA